MRRLALTAAVLAGLASAVPAHANGDAPRAEDNGVVTCALDYTDKILYGEYPTNPAETVIYVVDVTLDTFVFGVCIVI